MTKKRIADWQKTKTKKQINIKHKIIVAAATMVLVELPQYEAVYVCSVIAEVKTKLAGLTTGRDYLLSLDSLG